ncbi:MAG: hypothetical protein ABIT76_05015 [Chthoniobacterales bacterium]
METPQSLLMRLSFLICCFLSYSSLALVHATAETTVFIDRDFNGIARDVNLLGEAKFGGVEAAILVAGETAPDKNSSQVFLPFLLTDENRKAIVDAKQITLNVSLLSKSNVKDWELDLYGLPGHDAIGAGQEDYSSGELLEKGCLTGRSPAAYQEIDVTAFVKSQAKKSSFVALKLVARKDGDALPNEDELQNAFVFHSADQSDPNSAPFLKIAP